ncbi:hypothetical protein [Sphingomonas segetis]|uniref:hypothetical protein n=1 Tax=Sphingomonas segetis TaxID=1104779 RepID=UPI0012D326F8|nr:hypothetical protein [Sphingomonas segetis]
MNPWDIPAPNADDPSPRSVVPMFPHRMVQATRDDAALQAIRDRLNREARHITIRPVHPVADWLERTFADRLGWFIATLFPLCVAAFCLGYFGLRELLAGFGL